MKNDRVSNEQTAPKKLYKPRREASERKPEEVITYAADSCDDGYDDTELYPTGS